MQILLVSIGKPYTDEGYLIVYQNELGYLFVASEASKIISKTFILFKLRGILYSWASMWIILFCGWRSNISPEPEDVFIFMLTTKVGG